MNKEGLEMELLYAQKEKVNAEIKVLRKTTPFTESIKLFGSLVLGIGGVVTAIAGYQLSEVKSEKYKLEASLAKSARDNAKVELSILAESIQVAKKEYSDISDQIVGLKGKISNNPEASASIERLQADVNAADIELRTIAPSSKTTQSSDDMSVLIRQLFDLSALKRGQGYEELMARFSKQKELVPELIKYAEANMSNQNGIYNTLVVLSHLNHKYLGSDLFSIRNFAEHSRNNGPRTSERVDKLLKRLP